MQQMISKTTGRLLARGAVALLMAVLLALGAGADAQRPGAEYGSAGGADSISGAAGLGGTGAALLRPAQRRAFDHFFEFWDGVLQRGAGADVDRLAREHFHADAEWCFGECYRGVQAIADAVKSFQGMMISSRAAFVHVWPSGTDHTVAGKFQDAYQCRGQPDKVFGLLVRTYIEADPGTGKITKEIDSPDARRMAEVASSCSGGVPGAAFLPPGGIDEAGLDAAKEEALARWHAQLGIRRMPDSHLDAHALKYTDDAYEFCVNGEARCLSRRGLPELLRAWRGIVSDVTIDTRDTHYSGRGQVSWDWYTVAPCRHGGPPLSLSGYQHVFFDPATGRHRRNINVWDDVEATRQIEACLARAGKHSDL